MSISKRSQLVYYDFIIGLVIFSLAIGIFANSYTKENVQKNLENDARHISETIFYGQGLGFVDSYRLNMTKLDMIKSMQYQDIKKNLQIKADFYVYLKSPENVIFGTKDNDAENIIKLERIIINEGNLAKAGVVVWQ